MVKRREASRVILVSMAARHAQCFRFGPFEANLGSGELHKHGTRIRLQPQPFQVLALLLRHRGAVVTREQLRHELWPGDTYVDFNHGLNAAVRKLRSALNDSAARPRFIETCAKRGYRLKVAVEQPAPSRIASLVVLPFVNVSGDASEQYFADGVTEELIAHLARIGSLRVISSTSAMCYRNNNQAVADIARELDVDAVVKGSLQRSGDQIRIHAQLISAATDTHLLAKTCHGHVSEILLVQSTLASALAASLRGQLTEPERATLSRARPVVPAAYDAYLRARHAWGRGTSSDLNRAAILFDEAIAHDPTYPLAYVGLADSYLVRGFYSVLAPRDAYAKARAAAQRALELDETCGEAIASLANVALNFDWDWTAAEATYDRALAFTPHYATAHQWHAQLPVMLGRFDVALDRIAQAHACDPLSTRIDSMIGWVYYFARQYDRARRHLEAILEQSPRTAMAHFWLGQVLQQTGEFAGAVREIETGTMDFGASVHLGVLGSALAAAGRMERTHALVHEMRTLEEKRHFPAFALAEVYTALGEHDRAFAYLRKAYDQREPALLFVGVEPRMDPLRNDPRFDQLLDDIGLSVPRATALATGGDPIG